MASIKKQVDGRTRWYQYVTDFANIFKAFIGTNYLSLSFGFSQAGLGLGLLGLLLVSVLTNHCCKLIVTCKHIIISDICSKYQEAKEATVTTEEMISLRNRLRRNMDYSDIGRIALGKWGARLVNVFIVITQVGFCVSYMIFVANMVHNFYATSGAPETSINSTTLIPTQMPLTSSSSQNHSESITQPAVRSLSMRDLEAEDPSPESRSSFTPGVLHLTVLALPIFMALTLFRSVRQLGIISVVANLSILVGFISVMAYLLINFQLSASFSWFVWSTLPVYVAQVVGAYEAIGTILPIESSMDGNRHNFRSYINLVVIVFTCLIGLLAAFGYLHYGRDTQQIIAQNLPIHSPMVIVINITLILGVICTYPLQVFPIVEIVEGHLFGGEGTCCGQKREEMAANDTLNDQTALLSSSDEEAQLDIPIATYVPNTVPTWVRNLVRTGVAIVICILAVILRNVFAYVGALVGAIGSCPLAFILPCLFHWRLTRGKVSTLTVVKDWCILGFGVVCGTIGCVVTVQQAVGRI